VNQAALGTDSSSAVESRAWQVWGIARQELLYLCWAIMDVAIMAPVALTVMRWGRFWPAGQVTLWLLLLILLPFNLVRVLSSWEVPAKSQQRIVLAALVATLIITWRGLLYAPRPLTDMSWLIEFFGRVGESRDPQWARDLTVFFFVLAAWWRGLRLAQLTPDIYRIGFRLRAGGLLLAPIAYFLHDSGKGWAVTPYVLLYFLAGLTAVGLVRADQIERDRSGFAASLSPGWVASIFAVSLLVVVSAGLLAEAFSGGPATMLSSWLAPLWSALYALAAVSVSTFIYLMTPALNLLTFAFALVADALGSLFAGLGLRFGLENLANTDGLLPFRIPAPDEGESLIALPAPVSRTAILLVMLAVAALLSTLLTRSFLKVNQAPRSKTAAHAQVIGIEPASLGERILGSLGLLRRWRAAASIRHIYTSMCLAAAVVGYPRSSVETPYEYLATLAEVWPDNPGDSRLITEAFVRVRYGMVPESSAEVEEIRAAWQRLSTTQPAVSNDSLPLSTITDT